MPKPTSAHVDANVAGLWRPSFSTSGKPSLPVPGTRSSSSAAIVSKDSSSPVQFRIHSTVR